MGQNHDQGDDHGADDGPNHDQGDDHGDDAEGERNCSAADLTAGTRVHEAEAHTVGGGLVFEKVELLK